MSDWWDEQKEKAGAKWEANRNDVPVAEIWAWNAGWDAARKVVGEPVAKSEEGDLKSVAFREGWKAGYEAGKRDSGITVDVETPLEQRIEAMEDGLAGQDARLVRLTSELSGRISELRDEAALISELRKAEKEIDDLEARAADTFRNITEDYASMNSRMAALEQRTAAMERQGAAAVDLADVLKSRGDVANGRIQELERRMGEEPEARVPSGQAADAGQPSPDPPAWGLTELRKWGDGLMERIEKLEQRPPAIIHTHDVYVQPPSSTGTPTIHWGVAGGETKGATDE